MFEKFVPAALAAIGAVLAAAMPGPAHAQDYEIEITCPDARAGVSSFPHYTVVGDADAQTCTRDLADRPQRPYTYWRLENGFYVSQRFWDMGPTVRHVIDGVHYDNPLHCEGSGCVYSPDYDSNWRCQQGECTFTYRYQDHLLHTVEVVFTQTNYNDRGQRGIWRQPVFIPRGGAFSIADHSPVGSDLTESGSGVFSRAFPLNITFDEAVTGLTQADLVASNATITGLTGSGSSYTAFIEPGPVNGPMTVRLPFASAFDASNNPNAEAVLEMRVDRIAPTLEIGPPVFAGAGVEGPFTVELIFSEEMRGVSASDLVVSNGVLDRLDPVAGRPGVYLAYISPEPSNDDRVDLSFPAGAATDIGGNGNQAASLRVERDTTRPSAQLSGDEGVVTGPFSLTLTFSEKVERPRFGPHGIAVDNGRVGVIGDDEGGPDQSVFTVFITPAAQGPVNITQTEGAWLDDAGNSNTASNTLVYDYDGSPSVFISPREFDQNQAVNGPFYLDIEFGDPVTGLTVDSFETFNVTLSEFQGSGAEYSMLVTPLEENNDVVVELRRNTVQDSAGNGNEYGGFFTYADFTAPVLTLSSEATAPVDAAFDITLSASEFVKDVQPEDVLVTNGELLSFAYTAGSAEDESGAEFTLRAIPDGAGAAVVIDLPAGAFRDQAGNLSEAAQFQIDQTFIPFTAQLTSLDGALVSGDFDIAIGFPRPASGLESGDFQIENGFAAALTGSGADYVLTVRPDAPGPVTITLPAASVLDAGGNENDAGDPVSVEFDTVAPSFTLSYADGAPRAPAGPFDVDITATELVDGLEVSDLVVTNGVATALTGAGDRFIATITPSASAEITISLPSAAAVDLAGNESLAADTITVFADQTAPVVAEITRLDPAAEFVSSRELTWRVVFSDESGIDPLTLTTASFWAFATGISSPGEAGRVLEVTPISADTAQVTIEFTDLEGENPTLILYPRAGESADLAGNLLQAERSPSNAGVYRADFDNPLPVLTIDPPLPGAASGAFDVSIDFGEAISGFTASDLAVSGGQTGFLRADPSIDGLFRVAIQPSGNGVVTIALPADRAFDAAGNYNQAALPVSVEARISSTSRLEVARTGLGSGSVTGDGIDCGSLCEIDVAVGDTITLIAEPAPDSSFAGWIGEGCAGETTGICTFSMEIDRRISARFTRNAVEPGNVVAAVLPGARSGYLGGPELTVFLSVVSSATGPVQACSVRAPDGAPVSMSYKRIDASGAPVGDADPVFDLDAGETASFIMALTPSAETGPDGYVFFPVVECENGLLDPIEGVNSTLVSVDATPPPDLLSVVATPSNDGVVRIRRPGGQGVMTAAALNIGAGDRSAGLSGVNATVRPDTGDMVLPITLSICEIGLDAVCLAPPAAEVETLFQGDEPHFYAVYARSDGVSGIAFDPANARIYLRFLDRANYVRSVTSAAVTAPAPAAEAPAGAEAAAGRWSVLLRRDVEAWPGLVRASLHVAGDGRAVLDDGERIRLIPLRPSAGGADYIRLHGETLHGRAGLDGAIRLGPAGARLQDGFWGVRDARPGGAMAGFYQSADGAHALRIDPDGRIYGSAGGCVFTGEIMGERGGEAFALRGEFCAQAGEYLAVLDRMPDGAPAALLLAGAERGWRLHRAASD